MTDFAISAKMYGTSSGARWVSEANRICAHPHFFKGVALRTYIPTTVIETHKLAKFLARYQSILRPAVVAVDPSYGAIFDDLFAAVLAFDAIAQVIYPLES